MALTNEMPVVTSNLKTGFGVYGTADPFVSNTYPNNGFQNPLGSVWCIPSPSQSSTALATSLGYGSFLWVKYVKYLSTSNPAMVAGSGIVYYTDETLTTVSGAFAESFVASTPAYAAGFLLPNTGAVAGIGIGSAISATILNNGGLGSGVFIAIAGFVPSAFVGAGTAQGSTFVGAAGAFTPATTTTVLRPVGYVYGAIASSIADVVLTQMAF
jgi:hypothetical protein